MTTLGSPMSTRPMLDRQPDRRPAFGRFAGNPGEGLDCERCIRFVVEPEDPPARIAVPHHADERHDRPVAVVGHQLGGGGGVERRAGHQKTGIPS